MPTRALYVSWDGESPWYMESLFFPIFEKLDERGVRVRVLQFSFGGASHNERTRVAAEYYGVDAQIVALPRGRAARVAGLVRYLHALSVAIARFRPDVLIVRSTVPAALSLLLRRKHPHLRIVFDADGLPADERIEDLHKRADTRYVISRSIEFASLFKSDAIIVRSAAARDILIARAGHGVTPERVFVATNGRSPVQFRVPSDHERACTRATLGLRPDEPLAVYVGSLGPKYLPDWMAVFTTSFIDRQPNARVLMATSSTDAAHGIVARTSAAARNRTVVTTLPPDRIPSVLGAADVGLAFIRSSFASRAVSPIKIGEYLLCGCPVLTTSGIGDIDAWAAASSGAIEIVTDPAAAGRATRHSYGGLRRALRDHARQAGERWFTLDATITAYERAVAAALSSEPVV